MAAAQQDRGRAATSSVMEYNLLMHRVYRGVQQYTSTICDSGEEECSSIARALWLVREEGRQKCMMVHTVCQKGIGVHATHELASPQCNRCRIALTSCKEETPSLPSAD